MENWIKEQIRFGRTICLFDNNWNPILQINPVEYKKSLLDFIEDTFEPNLHHLIADNNKLKMGISGYNFYIYYPNQNNPVELYEVFSYFEEIDELLKTTHWKNIGTESDLFPDEIMDKIWNDFYSDIIVERINNFFYLIGIKLDRYYRNYYVYCLLCWIERNFEIIFTKLDMEDRKVKILIEKLKEEIIGIKNRKYSFESGCPQFRELCRKFNFYNNF